MHCTGGAVSVLYENDPHPSAKWYLCAVNFEMWYLLRMHNSWTVQFFDRYAWIQLSAGSEKRTQIEHRQGKHLDKATMKKFVNHLIFSCLFTCLILSPRPVSYKALDALRINFPPQVYPPFHHSSHRDKETHSITPQAAHDCQVCTYSFSDHRSD